MSEINETELKVQLNEDQVTFLLSEPSRREELCRYIVQNMYYDESKRKISFLKSGKQAV